MLARFVKQLKCCKIFNLTGKASLFISNLFCLSSQLMVLMEMMMILKMKQLQKGYGVLLRCSQKVFVTFLVKQQMHPSKESRRCTNLHGQLCGYQELLLLYQLCQFFLKLKEYRQKKQLSCSSDRLVQEHLFANVHKNFDYLQRKISSSLVNLQSFLWNFYNWSGIILSNFLCPLKIL